MGRFSLPTQAAELFPQLGGYSKVTSCEKFLSSQNFQTINQISKIDLLKAIKSNAGQNDSMLLFLYALYMDGGNALWFKAHKIFEKFIDAYKEKSLVPPKSTIGDRKKLNYWRLVVTDYALMAGPLFHMIVSAFSFDGSDSGLEFGESMTRAATTLGARGTNDENLLEIPNGGGHIFYDSFYAFLRSSFSQNDSDVLELKRLAKELETLSSIFLKDNVPESPLKMISKHPFLIAYLYHMQVLNLGRSNGNSLGGTDSEARMTLVVLLENAIVGLLEKHTPLNAQQSRDFIRERTVIAMRNENFITALIELTSATTDSLNYGEELNRTRGLPPLPSSVGIIIQNGENPYGHPEVYRRLDNL